MTIPLPGRGGEVGRELQRSPAPLGEVVALDRGGADLENPETLRRLILETRPTLVVNAAAHTAKAVMVVIR